MNTYQVHKCLGNTFLNLFEEASARVDKPTRKLLYDFFGVTALNLAANLSSATACVLVNPEVAETTDEILIQLHVNDGESLGLSKHHFKRLFQAIANEARCIVKVAVGLYGDDFLDNETETTVFTPV